MIGWAMAEAPRCTVLPLYAITTFAHGSNHRLRIVPGGSAALPVRTPTMCRAATTSEEPKSVRT